MEELIERLSKFFEEDELMHTLESYSVEELEELLEELEEEENDSQDVQKGDNSAKYIQEVKETEKKLQLYSKTLKKHIEDLQMQTRQPPFILPNEVLVKENARKIIKVKAKAIERYKEYINPQKKQEFHVHYKKYKEILKEVKKQIQRDDFLMAAAWAKWIIEKLVQTGYPGLIVIGVVLLAFLIMIIVVGVLVVVGETVETDGLESVFGVNGSNFYGVRLIYADESKEKSQIVSDYAGYITTAIKDIETNKPEIDITLEIPQEYNYFGEGESAQKTILTNIATEIYKIDNPGKPVPATLTEIVGGIKYFGIDENYHQVVADAIAKYINDNDLYQKSGETELPSEVETIIANQVSLSVARNVVRTEKLFIEDQVFESDTDVLKITQSKDYRAMIYMPKRDVTFNWFYVKAFRINSNYFKVYIQNGSAEPELLEYEFVEEEQYFYQSKTNLNWQVSAFDYDPQNPINGSLAELGKSQETLGLLTQAKDKDGNPIENVYTYANVGMQIKFVSDTPFMFAEAETQVK